MSHKLTVKPSANGSDELYLDGMRVRGLKGYRITSRQDDRKDRSINLELELSVSKSDFAYAPDAKYFDIAALVTPPAMDATADKE